MVRRRAIGVAINGLVAIVRKSVPVAGRPPRSAYFLLSAATYALDAYLDYHLR